MPLARLVLFPKLTSDLPDSPDTLVGALRDIGFITEEIDLDGLYAHTYLPGIEFLNLLTFLGCSPHIHLHPDDGDPFCYLAISAMTPTAVCLGHATTARPRCPSCKNIISDWKNIDNWQQADSWYTCDHCGTQSTMSRLNWRHECGYGRFSLQLANIHPFEAVPSDRLLLTLSETCGFDWEYCYAID